MSGERVYLDYNATAPLAPGVRDAVCAALDQTGNPSSVHREGRAARAIVETAREKVASLAGVAASRVIFTSGATEAANLALTPDISTPAGRGFDRLIVAGGEHPCVMEGHRFPPDSITIAPLKADGSIDLYRLQGLLDAQGCGRCILALQAANNETGVVQPVREAAALMHANHGILVCDAVQGVHRMDCSPAALGADILFFSAHKIGGPKGAGALALVNGGLEIRSAALKGGGQERGLRAGTENVAAIAGFGAAALLAAAERESEAVRLKALRDDFEAGLIQRFPGVTIFGAGAQRLCNTSAFALEAMPAETMLIGLDLEGIAVSSGSACSSGKVRPSHVLESMGVAPDLSRCALRISLGRGTDAREIEQAFGAIDKVAGRMNARRMKPAA